MGTPGLSPQTSSLVQNVQNFKWHHSHSNKSKYLTPATETRTRGSHGFNILLKIQVKNSEGME